VRDARDVVDGDADFFAVDLRFAVDGADFTAFPVFLDDVADLVTPVRDEDAVRRDWPDGVVVERRVVERLRALTRL